jgi:sugar lactone lactonase YvrE/dienelactone hydrolase
MQAIRFIGLFLCLGGLVVQSAEFKPTAQNRFVPKGAKLEMVWAKGKFTEGPTLGPKGVIYFSDIGDRTMLFDPGTGKTTVFRAKSGKSNGLMMDRRGNLIACEGGNGGTRRISLTTPAGKTRTLADKWNGKKFNSPNDLAIDAKGRIYFTDPRYAGDEPREIDFEGVFLVERDGSVKLATKELQKPNGILVSLDGKHVFVADNNNAPQGNRHLARFVVQADGSLAGKKVMFDFGPERRGIDGMTLDVNGNIYATAGKGDRAGVYVFSPTGKNLAFIPTPGSPTNCVFGGEAEKGTLYITAQSAKQADGSRPWALFRIKLNATGHHIFPAQKKTVVYEELAAAVRALPANVFPEAERNRLRQMMRTKLRGQLQAANDRSRKSWNDIQTRAQWEAFSQARIAKLRQSLGHICEPPANVKTRVTGELKRNGFRIRKLLFESRPGFWVTANLYLPAQPRKGMPAISIVHSHHRPKEHGELQDMGATWARAGCAVLVMDQLGHGERRQHPFATAADYAKEFRVSRQDYYHRYDTALQLQLAGESLIGWMAWDISRGFDVLHALPGVDKTKTILLGAVAGGGDPCAVAAALDDRITCAVPFNFGGPQPETRFPLPSDAETSFNYAGSGSWESTRNLAFSARDGFLPWVIVGSIAPRRLIFAHEFNWDRPRDPVWKRLEKIYGFYNAPANLDFTHGFGELRGSSPKASHCTHIGKPHRVRIHAAVKKWFGIEATEFSDRVDAAKLHVWTPEARAKLKPRQLTDLLPALAKKRQARAQWIVPSGKKQRALLRTMLDATLGRTAAPKPKLRSGKTEKLAGGLEVLRAVLETEPGIEVPLMVLTKGASSHARPVVVGLAQGGKARFLKHRAEEITRLLAAGVAVCLPDVRGTGETRAGDSRGRSSADTSRSATALMTGDLMVAARLRDARSVLAWLRSRSGFDGKRVALWGESFAPVNAAGTDFKVPRRVNGQPRQSEPLGDLLAVLGGLYEEEVVAVFTRGGLRSFAAILGHFQVLVPHDVVVPGMLRLTDLPQITKTLGQPVLRVRQVNHLNQRVDNGATDAAQWLLGQLRVKADGRD